MTFPEKKKKNTKRKVHLLENFPLAPMGSEVYWLFSFVALGKDRNSKTQVTWLSKNRTRFFCLFVLGIICTMKDHIWEVTNTKKEPSYPG